MDRSLLLVKLTVPLTALTAIFLLMQFGADNHGIREALRATARVSLVLFLLAYVASPFHRTWPSAFSRWLIANRATIGICFALCLSSHIVLILWLFALHAPLVPAGIGPADFLIGIPGLITVVLMAITSLRQVRKIVPALWWSRLHRYGIHLVWFIYAACLIDSFIGKSPPNPSWHYLPFISALITAFALRIAASTRHRETLTRQS